MRAAPLLVLLLWSPACADEYQAPLSYGRCAGAELCGLETRCDRITASTTGATTLLCTLPCGADRDCPGLDAVCVTGVATGDAGAAGRCLRACSADAHCRPGTVCRALGGDAGAGRVCVASVM